VFLQAIISMAPSPPDGRPTSTLLSTPTPLNAANLLNAPTEPLLQIMSQLHLSDIQALRLSCQHFDSIFRANKDDLYNLIAKTQFPMQYALRLANERQKVSLRDISAYQSSQDKMNETNILIDTVLQREPSVDLGPRKNARSLLTAGLHSFIRLYDALSEGHGQNSDKAFMMTYAGGKGDIQPIFLGRYTAELLTQIMQAAFPNCPFCDMSHKHLSFVIEEGMLGSKGLINELLRAKVAIMDGLDEETGVN
jgi:hypothetical protein